MEKLVKALEKRDKDKFIKLMTEIIKVFIIADNWYKIEHNYFKYFSSKSIT